MDDSSSEHDVEVPCLPVQSESSPIWERTLKQVIPAIVSIRTISVRNFDTEIQRTSQATGFVVDADQGIILSNRHVVQPGPILAEAIFNESKEEVKLIPIYRDPVHDFGFFRFDPKKIKYNQLTDIPLAPEKARVGIDVRVIGNDAGERLSILAGTLARLDRKAPYYGAGKYNDWNTFYYQAASMTSGGSSGSPVINSDGCCIALNAGGSTASASSFFLPLDRVVRALSLIQQHKPVSRGTIQTVFQFTTYDEVKRLGLDIETEYTIRNSFPEATGMLVVGQVLPKGPADGILESGDILLKVNDEWIVSFVPLETLWDDNVDKNITIDILRGQQKKTLSIKVQDLHSITPSRYLQVGGGVVHDISYQIAKSYMVPVQGVYVAGQGYMIGMSGVGRRCIIESVKNIPTPDLESFINVMNQLRDAERVSVRFYALADINKTKMAIMQVDRRWHDYQLAQRNDETGLWDYKPLPAPQGRVILEPHNASHISLDDALGPAKYVISSLVFVEFHLPWKIDGVAYQVHSGIGLVLRKGLLVVDRHAIPCSIGDILLTFANSIIIPGRLKYLHPMFNFALVEYDPLLLGNTPVKEATLSDVSLLQGDSVYAVCVSKTNQPIVRKTIVTNIRQFFVSEPTPPSYRSINVEGIELENSVSHGGVLTDAQGRVQALYVAYTKHSSKTRSEFYMGLDIRVILPALKEIADPSIQLMGLDIEMTYAQIAHARVLGLTDEWVKRIESTHSSRRNVIVIRKVTAEAACSKFLEAGDVILAVNGEAATHFVDITKHTTEKSLELTILRHSKEIQLQVPLCQLPTSGTENLVGWVGAIFHMPHKAVYQALKSIPKGVLCSIVFDGSPAQMYGLTPLTFVTAINDTPTPDLETFIHITSQIPTDAFVRVKTVNFNRFSKVISIRTNKHYFGTWKLIKDNDFKLMHI